MTKGDSCLRCGFHNPEGAACENCSAPLVSEEWRPHIDGLLDLNPGDRQKALSQLTPDQRGYVDLVMGWVAFRRRGLMRFHTKIAGVTHQNSDGTERQRVVRTCVVGEEMVLRREPGNPVDPNAVMVLRPSGQQVGYLKREVAREIAPFMDMGLWVGAVVTELTGGTFGKPSRGVNIEVYRPHHKPRAKKVRP